VLKSIDHVIAPLFVPADRPERFGKACRAGADAVILDLEDAVSPDRKDAARGAVLSHGIDSLPVIIRINGVESDDFDADIGLLQDADFDAIMLAKVKSPDDILVLKRRIPGNYPVVALIESAAGVRALEKILTIDSVKRIAFGAFDFALDIGCQPVANALLFARSQLVLLSRVAGRPGPWDSPATEISDVEAIAESAADSAMMGFGGKLAIHPGQLSAIFNAFCPDDDTIDWARAVLETTRRAGSGAKTLHGQMIDKPLIERARRILQVAGSADL